MKKTTRRLISSILAGMAMASLSAPVRSADPADAAIPPASSATESAFPPLSPLAERADPAEVELTGDWTLKVVYRGQAAEFRIAPPDYVDHQNEVYESLPLFNSDGPSWRKALPLLGIRAAECSVFDALVPGSLQVRLLSGDEKTLTPGVDYGFDEASGNIGRLEGGAIGEKTPVCASYRSVEMRIDSVILKTDGTLTLVGGVPNQVNPTPPEILHGEKRLVNVWISGRIDRLSDDHIFPILSDDPISSNDDSAPRPDPIARKLCPKTYEKLEKGGTVHILAWGDSVTACGYLPDSDRWQQQFVDRLAKRFPKADIVLQTEAWGGRATANYMAEPAGSQKNYQEKVLDMKPDLILSEFVNDAYLDAAGVEKQYGQIRDDFKKIGAEWIIIAPHYVRPDWMGLTRQKNIDDDPRPYVKAIRKFAAENGIALADASALYGRLWRKGIPYNTLMVNNINHPNRLGMTLFADALMTLF